MFRFHHLVEPFRYNTCNYLKVLVISLTHVCLLIEAYGSLAVSMYQIRQLCCIAQCGLFIWFLPVTIWKDGWFLGNTCGNLERQRTSGKTDNIEKEYWHSGKTEWQSKRRWTAWKDSNPPLMSPTACKMKVVLEIKMVRLSSKQTFTPSDRGTRYVERAKRKEAQASEWFDQNFQHVYSQPNALL